MRPARPGPSLFVRSFAVLAALMLVSVLAWLAAYTWFEREPRAAQLAQWVVTSVNVVRPALMNADADKRLSLLAELARREDIRIYPAVDNEPVTPLVRSALMASLMGKVRASLGQTTRFASAIDGTEGFWVSFAIAPADEYWLRLPMEPITRKTPLAWLGWAVAAMLLALAGAWLLVAYVTRPLTRLSQAAENVARGELAPALAEDGPPEVANVARTFNHMSRTLAQVEADRAFSLAGVSHDLRTPLTRLRLEIEMASIDDATREAMVRDIAEMDAMIAQFMDYARGLDDEPYEAVALADLLAALGASFGRQGARIEFSRGELPVIQARPLALRRAVSNLLHNAMQYAGIDQPIRLEARALGHSIEVDVMDRGPGITAEHGDHLKRAFVRGNAARSGVSGSGLGLAIVERVARAHGGQLHLLPREGGGLVARLTVSINTPH